MAAEQITYKNIDPKVRKMIMLGLGLAMLIACFDGTIVGTCAPRIIEDLHGAELYAWMITAYMLCETVMIPISGKLSDLYGRKPLFLIGLTIFVAGSFLAGLSTSMEMFIACRAIQGLGGGILIPVATAAVADLYSPRERARMQGMLGAIFGIGSGIGPLIGGYITEYISWHWIFYINIPMAAAAYVLTIKKFPTPISDSASVRIDKVGIVLLSVMLIDVLLFFQFGGDKFDWFSITSFAMVALALALIALFVINERRVPEPIIAPHLIHNSVVVKAALFMFIFGIAMMGAMTYASMFSIYVLGYSVLDSAYYSLALVAGMMITSLSSGALLEKTGYRLWLCSGPVIAFAGLYLMSQMTVGTTVGYYVMSLFILGFGLGCFIGVIMTAVQNSSENSEIGMTTSAVNLIRSVGATIGSAIFAMVISNKIDGELFKLLPEAVYDIVPHNTGVLDSLLDPEFWAQVAILVPDQVNQVAGEILLAFANSVDFAFLTGGVLILLLVFIGIIFKVKKPSEIGSDVLIPEGDAIADDSQRAE
jgi:EmrB/QacA subfamily drug resistance transporter